jgi:hypothetical protein
MEELTSEIACINGKKHNYKTLRGAAQLKKVRTNYLVRGGNQPPTYNKK